MPRQPIDLQLEEPLNSYGETITKLSIACPRGSDILECGYPFATERNPRTGTMSDSINVPALRLLLSKMAQVPESTIDQLSSLDFFKAVDIIKFFFMFTVQKAAASGESA